MPAASSAIRRDVARLRYLGDSGVVIAFVFGAPAGTLLQDHASVRLLPQDAGAGTGPRSGVQVVVGPVAAFEALAINDYLQEAELPFLCCSAAAEDLTQRRLTPWFVRTSSTSAQPCHPLGDYAAREIKYNKIVSISDDFSFCQEQTSGFQRTFEATGGTLVNKLWAPLNVADYGTYISQIGEPDAVFAAFAGANSLRFLRQYSEYGLKAKIPLVGSMTTVDEGVLLSMGDEAIGIISAGWYSAALPSEANARNSGSPSATKTPRSSPPMTRSHW
jgi:branched-chain amino acid transport system substrate-binding protein